MPRPFTTLAAQAAPLQIANIDTDQIIPSREMRSTGKTGLAKGLFAGWRYLPGGDYQPDPNFVLNQPQYNGAQILLGGENFGCGSSREHAVWALDEYGIRAVIAPSFAPIFENNCSRNGLLCVKLPATDINAIKAASCPVHIDLDSQQVSLPDGQAWSFAIDAEVKMMLISGMDAIDLTLQHKAAIADWQSRDAIARAWIYL